MEIPEQQLSNLREIYRDPSGKTFIYFGEYTPPSGPSIPVAIKKIRCTGMHECYIYCDECRNQMRIPGENVCRIFGWNMSPDLVTIVMERLDNDLAKEIAMRKEQSFPYSEVELLRFLWDVVNVFAEMQLISLSHCDIKAENIFVLKRNGVITYKVGDFGSASTVRSHVNGLKGTPLYLSPILKREYHKASYGGPAQNIYHSPIKSDVFSLGVTLIYAAELQTPSDLLDDSNLEWKLNSHMQRIQPCYPTVAFVLGQMLIMDETKRCDFEDIRNYLITLDQLKDHRKTNPIASIPKTTVQATNPEDYVDCLNIWLEREEWEIVENALEILERKGDLAALVAKAQRWATKCLHCLNWIPLSSKQCESCHMPKSEAVSLA